MRRPSRALVPALVLGLGLSLTGCLNQPEAANDNGPQPQPEQPGDVVRTPAAEEDVPLVETEQPAEGDEVPDEDS